MHSRAQPESKEARLKALMKEGKEAFASGHHSLAHDIWREAATLDPYNEQVWLALLRVLESNEDRRVCLQNIIAINPTNVRARHMLRQMHERVERRAAPTKPRQQT